jgi:hypothetical protein
MAAILGLTTFTIKFKLPLMVVNVFLIGNCSTYYRNGIDVRMLKKGEKKHCTFLLCRLWCSSDRLCPRECVKLEMTHRQAESIQAIFTAGNDVNLMDLLNNK